MSKTMKNCNDYSKEYIGNLFKEKNKKEIYEKYKNNYPLDIESLIKGLGIKVEYKDLPDKISGLFNGKDTIEINKWHAPARQRFTLAHELGHYLMHDGDCHRQSLVAYTDKDQKKERDANLFARSILMPIDEIENLLQSYKERIEQGGFNFVEPLIKKFEVSTDALKVRLMTLGFIEGW